MTKHSYAIDFGTTKFCLALHAEGQSGVKILSIPSQGMRRGMLSDLASVKESLEKLVELSEQEFCQRISKVHIGISGFHLVSKPTSIIKEFKNPEKISHHHLRALENSVKKTFSLESKQIVDLVPLEYEINKHHTLDNPVGFFAKNIKARYMVFLADDLYVKNLVTLCNDCGLEVLSVSAEPIASASVLNKNPAISNFVVADIGGGTTDGLIFLDNKPTKIFTINIGGHLTSKDLTYGLGISYKEAEELKKLVGLQKPQDIFDIWNTQSQTSHKKAYEIMLARTLELADYLKKELLTLGPLKPQGIYLTGGGSRIKNIAKVIEEHLLIPTKTLDPYDFTEHLSVVQDLDPNSLKHLTPNFATVVGILKLRADKENKFRNSGNQKSPHFFKQFISWIKEMS